MPAVRQRNANCLTNCVYGGTIGAIGGGSFGLFLGGAGAYSGGLRGRDLFRAAGKAGAQSGAMFGLFLAIGTGLRVCL